MIRTTPYITIKEVQRPQYKDVPDSPTCRQESISRVSTYHSSFFNHPAAIISGSILLTLGISTLTYIIACQFIDPKIIQDYFLTTMHLTIPHAFLIIMITSAVLATLNIILEFNYADLPKRPDINNF